MQFLEFFKTIDALRDGVTIPVLCWYEPDGDESVIHFMVHPDEADVQIDVKLRGPAQEIFERFADVDDKEIEHILDTAILPTMARLAATGSGAPEEES